MSRISRGLPADMANWRDSRKCNGSLVLLIVICLRPSLLGKDGVVSAGWRLESPEEPLRDCCHSALGEGAVVTGREHIGVSWNTSDILFLELPPGYTGVFSS